jgi:hypothetical protein
LCSIGVTLLACCFRGALGKGTLRTYPSLRVPTIQVEDKIFGEYWLECFATEILDAKYKKTDVAEVVKGLTHLNAHQKADLLRVLQENNKMFNGTLGVYPHKKVHIDIDPSAKPVHSRPYSVP